MQQTEEQVNAVGSTAGNGQQPMADVPPFALATAASTHTPLVVFRLLFGLLHAYGALRFMLSGWIEKLYDEPTFFFKFYGFSWVPEVSGSGAYLLYSVIFLSALAIAIGAFYREATVVFFLAFSWAELIDATNYLNHYYLVCLLSFLLIFIPAHRFYSVDARRNPAIARLGIPKWCRPALLIQLSMVYFFAGVAKLNADWLFHAMPLAVWLPTKADFPVLGPLFAQEWTAYAFSWFGAFYDLTIVGWLLWKPTRPLAYVAVLAFHLLTWCLFNIGLFPLIMITSTLLFFPAGSRLMRTAERSLQALFGKLPTSVPASEKPAPRRPTTSQSAAFWESAHGSSHHGRTEKIGLVFNLTQRLPLVVFFTIQLLLPLRNLLYPGTTFWTEEGYRFGWRVMLVEKTGQATFYVHDPATGNRAEVNNREFLTEIQEKQMAIQPDYRLQLARPLAEVFQARYGLDDLRVTADVFVALNGRPSQRFIDPEVNLAAEVDNFQPKTWILPLEKRPATRQPSSSFNGKVIYDTPLSVSDALTDICHPCSTSNLLTFAPVALRSGNNLIVASSPPNLPDSLRWGGTQATIRLAPPSVVRTGHFTKSQLL